jgi:hypothetical protein
VAAPVCDSPLRSVLFSARENGRGQTRWRRPKQTATGPDGTVSTRRHRGVRTHIMGGGRGSRPVPCNTNPRTQPVSKSRGCFPGQTRPGWRSVRTRRSRPAASIRTKQRIEINNAFAYCDREAARPVSVHDIPVQGAENVQVLA